MLKRTFTLGRYHCVERLASGPLGETWRARRYGPAGVEGQFALKRLHAHLARDRAFLGRLNAAVDRYRALAHEGAARLHDVGEEESQHFLVFELVAGGSLQRLRPALRTALGGDAPARLVAAVAIVGRQLAEIVAAAQERGLSAQGLSPQTALVDSAGRVRVLDLGLVSARLSGAWQGAPEVAPLLPYLAPEVVQGEPPDLRSDLFSLGALLLELLTGAVPPEAALRPGGRPPPPAQVPLALWEALWRALQPRAADRPASAQELAHALADAGPEEEAQALLAQFGASLGRTAEPKPPAEALLPPPGVERVMVASSAESQRRADEVPLAAPLPALQPLPVAAALALAPRQLSGVVLAVEEDEHTVPVPHSPKSKIKVIEAEPPGGSRVGLGASLREPEPTPTSGASAVSNPGAEVTAVPGLNPDGRPWSSGSEGPTLGGDGEPGAAPDSLEGALDSGPTALTAAAPPRPPPTVRVIPGGMAAAPPSGSTIEPDPEDLSEFDEPTALADFSGPEEGAREPAPAGGPTEAAPPGAATPDPFAGLLGDEPPPSRPEQFAPLVTDPVPRVSPTEIEAELPFASAALTPVPPLASPRLPAALALPSLSKDDDGLDETLGEDEPTGSIPNAPRRLVELVQTDQEAEQAGTEPAAAEEPPLTPLLPVTSAPPLPAPAAPAATAPQALPAATSPLETAPPAVRAGPPPAGLAPASWTTAVTAPRPAVQRTIGPSVILSFVAALLVGGSVPLLVRALRKAPRPAPAAGPATAAQPPARPASAPAPPPAAAPQPDAPPAAPGARALALSSKPAGAAVFVDGKPAGRTPLMLQLQPGPHRLLVMAERYKLWRKEVSGGGSVEVALQPAALPPGVAGPGGLKVRCTTRGQLRIFVDGHDSGYNCPSERIALSPGTHRVEFFHPRTGDTVGRQVTIKKGKTGSTRLYMKY